MDKKIHIEFILFVRNKILSVVSKPKIKIKEYLKEILEK